MNTLVRKLAAALVLLWAPFAWGANITAIYSVTDTGEINCSQSGGGPDAPHGIWTNNLSTLSGECKDYFSFNGTFTQFDDGTATLTGSGTNPQGVVATLDMEFGGLTNSWTPIKTAGGSDTSDWVFYPTIDPTSGITILGTLYLVQPHGGYALQVGTGANDKTGVFGASVWLDAAGANTGHWDLNLDLTPVPLPAAVWLFGSGIAGLLMLRRRRTAKLAAQRLLQI